MVYVIEPVTGVVYVIKSSDDEPATDSLGVATTPGTGGRASR